MGLTHIKASVANPAKPRRSVRLTFFVDSGAVYSVVPGSVLRKLGVKPHSRRSFILADGSQITRRMGDLLFRFDQRQGASPVIFGEEGDSTLFGSVSLEALGFILDPIRRELRPLPMLLMPQQPGRHVTLKSSRLSSRNSRNSKHFIIVVGDCGLITSTGGSINLEIIVEDVLREAGGELDPALLPSVPGE